MPAIAAQEMQVKLISGDVIHAMAGILGDGDPDSTTFIDYMSTCQEINQMSLDWAEARANADALRRYKQHGKKLSVGKDYQFGIFGHTYLQFEDNSDKSETLVRSPVMNVEQGPMSHVTFCKLLSPFRALEWIYIDSQYDHNCYECDGAAEEESLWTRMVSATMENSIVQAMLGIKTIGKYVYGF